MDKEGFSAGSERGAGSVAALTTGAGALSRPVDGRVGVRSATRASGGGAPPHATNGRTTAKINAGASPRGLPGNAAGSGNRFATDLFHRAGHLATTLDFDLAVFDLASDTTARADE